LNQFEPDDEDDHVIHESDYGDVARNNLNRAKQIACRAGSNQSRVPGRLRMFEHKVENMGLLFQFLRLFSPGRKNCGQSSAPANPSHQRSRIRDNRIVELAFQRYRPLLIETLGSGCLKDFAPYQDNSCCEVTSERQLGRNSEMSGKLPKASYRILPAQEFHEHCQH